MHKNTQRGAKLGQHFLTRPETAAWVADAAHLSPHDIVVEIGPGKGILTKELLARTGKVYAVEKDSGLIDELTIRFEKDINDEKLVIIEHDIRDFDPDTLQQTPYHLVANIPYYLTGHIIRMFLTAPHQPATMTLLVQKEVAQRMTASDGKESLLSLSVRAYGTPKMIRIVKAGAFTPPPKVDSAIVHISDISRQKFASSAHEERYFDLLHHAFSAKRKQIGNTVPIAAEKLARCDILPQSRPETIGVKQWLKLALL